MEQQFIEFKKQIHLELARGFFGRLLSSREYYRIAKEILLF